VQALVETARNLSQQDPCQAAELLQQALDIADTPDIESLRQEMLARCRQQSSPLPTPPPSQRIAYTAYDIPSGLYSIRTWNLDDQQPGSKLMDWAMQPAFGPGGDLIYRSIQPDSPGVTLRQPDGVTRQITLGPDDSWPRWGPGGQQIIFTSAQRSADGSPHLYLVDTATQAVEELGPGRHADWSRTGQIIFSGCDAGGQNCGLWRLNPTTLQRTQVTTAPDDSNPVWSPDGAAVLFMSSSRGESWDIFILDIQTGAVTPTATHPAEDGLPAWSPDGRAFAFLSNRDGEWGVYTWRLSDHATTKRFTIGPTLPNWQQAGLDWGP
jgi:Tol biopolymer transport system component